MNYLLFFIVFSLLAQTNSAQWKVHIIDNCCSGADGIKFADINNDGRLDIATGWEESGISKVYLQPELGEIRKNWPSVVVGKTSNVEDAVFADMNSNGIVDVVSLTENNSQKIFIHWNPGKDYLNASKWKQELLPASEGIMSWMFAEPMQVDGINGTDLIAAGKGKNASIGWFEAPDNAADLIGWTWHEISKVGWIMSIYNEDMDADGDFDVVITDRTGELKACRWLENPGIGELQKMPWKNHFIGAKGLEVMFMCISDINNDGIKEVLVSERTENTIRIFSETNTSWKEKIIELPGTTGKAKSVEVGDMNNDGVVDLIVSTNTLENKKDGLIWLDGNKLNVNQENSWQSISGVHKAKYDKVELMDVDKDGDLDILICEENFGENSKGLGVVWYENPHKK